jgi:sugar diacid utilization regulator
MNETDAKIVVAYARCNMRATKTAETLHYHRQTILQHFDKIRYNTGLDPRNFFDLGELYEIAVGILGDDY